MGACDGHELTASPESHWVKAGDTWLNMARVAFVRVGSSNPDAMWLYFDSGDEPGWYCKPESALALRTYLCQHLA